MTFRLFLLVSDIKFGLSKDHCEGNGDLADLSKTNGTLIFLGTKIKQLMIMQGIEISFAWQWVFVSSNGYFSIRAVVLARSHAICHQ